MYLYCGVALQTGGVNDVKLLDQYLVYEKASKVNYWEFPGVPVVKTLPSTAGVVDLIAWRGSKDLTCLVAKKQKNRNNIATISIKILKMFHIKKKKKTLKNVKYYYYHLKCFSTSPI